MLYNIRLTHSLITVLLRLWKKDVDRLYGDCRASCRTCACEEAIVTTRGRCWYEAGEILAVSTPYIGQAKRIHCHRPLELCPDSQITAPRAAFSIGTPSRYYRPGVEISIACVTMHACMHVHRQQSSYTVPGQLTKWISFMFTPHIYRGKISILQLQCTSIHRSL